MKRRDFLKCSLAVGAGLAASPSTYAFNGERKAVCLCVVTVLHPVVRLHVPVCSRGCLHGTMGCWDMGRWLPNINMKCLRCCVTWVTTLSG